VVLVVLRRRRRRCLDGLQLGLRAADANVSASASRSNMEMRRLVVGGCCGVGLEELVVVVVVVVFPMGGRRALLMVCVFGLEDWRDLIRLPGDER